MQHLRVDHDPQRQLLQVRELRDDQRLRIRRKKYSEQLEGAGNRRPLAFVACVEDVHGARASQRELEDAFATGAAVEGKVASVIKGSYEVRIARERAFCPLSQIDIVRTTDPAVHVGETYAFRVTECKDGGKSIVSRRKQLEEEQQASAAALHWSRRSRTVLRSRPAIRYAV